MILSFLLLKMSSKVSPMSALKQAERSIHMAQKSIKKASDDGMSGGARRKGRGGAKKTTKRKNTKGSKK